MSQSNITHLFNAYDLQADPYEADKLNCQEVVDYCEARFRAALQSMNTILDEYLGWMTMALFRELELCFSYIGVAAAIGHSINIPIIVRTLGHDLYRFGMKPNTYFRPGVELLAYLDGNLSGNGPDDPNLLVTEFHVPWWRGTEKPNRSSQYLSYRTLMDALAQHRIRLGEAGVTGSYTKPDKLSRLNKPLYSWHPEVHADLVNPCTRCRLYRANTFGTLDKLRDLENYAQGMAVANFGEVDIGMRRASGFNELYEEVLKKEVELEQTMSSGPMELSDSGSGLTFGRAAKKKGKKKSKGKERDVSKVAERVRTEARKQLLESTAGHVFGQVESKWTWGVELDSQDIWNMMRGADKSLQIPHSGYDDELRTGPVRSSSPIPSPNDIEEPNDPDVRFDLLTHDPFIRDLCPDEVPIAFSFPTLHYMAAGESVADLEQPPLSGSEYGSTLDEKGAERAVGEVNDPNRSDTQPVIPERGQPPTWVGHPPPGYVPLPPPSNTFEAETALFASPEGDHNLAVGILENVVGAESEADPFLVPHDVHLGTDDESDIIMDVVSSSSCEQEVALGDLGMESDILELVEPDESEESDREIEIGNLGLVASDSDEEINVGDLGLEFVATGMWAESDRDGLGPRPRARISLPRVHPETGLYTADSFSNVPNEWFD